MQQEDDILELSDSELEIEPEAGAMGPNGTAPDQVAPPPRHGYGHGPGHGQAPRGHRVDPLAATRAPWADGGPPVDPTPLEDEPTRIEGGDPAPPPDPVIESDQPRLAIIGGNDRGKEFMLGYQDTSIGRGLDNDLVLADIAVSRKHTLICFENGGYVVRDLGSGNGTLINGVRQDLVRLSDGDQVEVGNTLIRYIDGTGGGGNAELASAPTVVGAVSDISGAPPNQTMDVRGQPMPYKPDAGTTDGRKAAGAKPKRTKKLLIFGGLGLVVFLGAMIGVKAVLKKKRRARAAAAAASKTSPDELAARHFEEGTKQYRARNWEKARSHYLKVLAVAPGFDQAKRYADKARAEMKARDALASAKSAIKTKDYTTALESLAKVPPSSVYRKQAVTLKQRVDDNQVQDLLESAKLLRDSGDKEGALAKVRKALKVAPSNEAVKALHAELTGTKAGSSRGRRPVASAAKSYQRPAATSRRRVAIRRVAPRNTSPRTRAIRVSGSGARRALSLYRQQQWGPAYQAASSYAASASGRAQRRAEKLKDTIRKVGQAMIRAQRMQTRDPSQAMRYYQKALALDRRVPRRPHQSLIKERLAKVARVLAMSALAGGRYSTAYRAVKVARKYGGNSSAISRVMKRLEGEAKKLFTRGYTIRTRNKAKARRLWQQVLKMVPPSNPFYQKAYSWLNNSGPSYQDDDED